ncbi:MAG: TRAP transporter substrate-binding protein DctP [Thermodesulfobacteriota bacterium]
MDRRWGGRNIFILAILVLFIFAFVMPADAQTKPAKIFSWKIQSAWPPPEKVFGYWGGYGQVVEITKRVRERTKGGLDIKVFPPNALFKVLESPDAVRKGAIEMICSSGPYHVGILPEALLEWGLPYGAKTSQESAKLILETEFLSILRKAYMEKHNAYLLGLTGVSSYNYITRFPIQKLEDLKGKKIRATGTSAKIAAAHGAVPVSLSGAEQYMALQRGTVDGTIYPPYAGISYKMFEVAKHQSWPPIYATANINFLINLNAWQQLPRDFQQILEDEVAKMMKYTYYESSPALEKIAQEEGKKQFDAESTWLSESEFARFRQAVMPLWEEWEKKSPYCAQLVKLAKERMSK